MHLGHLSESCIGMRNALRIVMFLSLAGCSSGDPGVAAPTNAQQRSSAYQQAITSILSPIQACNQVLLQDENNAAAAALIPFHNSSLITVSHLSNAARPTEVERRRIVTFMQGIDRCWAGAIPALRSIDPVFADIAETDLREDRMIAADLSQGRLTLGDANRRMQSEDVRIRERRQAHMQQLGTHLWQQHNAELALRQNRAATQQAELAALGAQMQQLGQNFNAGAQANLYNSSAYRAPQVQSFAPPANTIVNCFQTGPIVHCR